MAVDGGRLMTMTTKDKLLKYLNPHVDQSLLSSDDAAPLVIRFGAMGDMILTTPLLRALAQRHNRPCEVVGQGGFPGHVFKNLPFVQSVRAIESNKTPFVINKQKQSLVEWLKRRNNGPVYLLQSDIISHKIFDRAGVAITESDLTNEKRINEHVIDHMARLGGFTDDKGDVIENYSRGTELQVTDDEIEGVKEELDRLEYGDHEIVIIQPGFRKCMNKHRRERKGKFWPENRWVRTIQEILNIAPDKRVILSGSPEEKPLIQSIADTVNDHRCTELVLPLRPMFALISIAHSMLSLDTGPAHASAALNCPLVVLFGKMDPRIIRPMSRTSPVHVLYGPPGAPLEDDIFGWQKHHEMEGIAIETVVETWATNLLEA